MRVIAVSNQKGGCGKTTTAINLSAALAERGRRVLLVDLDPQGHASLGLGVQAEALSRTVFEVLATAYEEAFPLREAVVPVLDGLDLAPCNVSLAALEQKLAGTPGRENRLRFVLDRLGADGPRYDYVLLDSPPAVGLLTFNALRAASEALIPVEPSCFALQGLQKMVETLEIFRTKLGHSIRMRILPTLVDRRTRLSQAVVEHLRATWPLETLRACVHASVRVREAAGLGRPVARLDRRCAAWADYLALAEELDGAPLILPAGSRAVPAPAVVWAAEGART